MTEQTVKTADVTEAELQQMQMDEAVAVADDMMDDEHGMTRFMMQIRGVDLVKPDAANAPEGATVLIQNANGAWVYGTTKKIALHVEEGNWIDLDNGDWIFDPEYMGWSEPTDWQNSLELLSEDVQVVPVPTGKPTWDDAPEGALTLVGGEGAWRFTSYGAVIADSDGFKGIGSGELLAGVWFDDSMVGGPFVEYRDGEPTQEALESMGKPSWDDAPEEATVLVRNSDGAWRFGSFAEVKQRDSLRGTGWVPADFDEETGSVMPGEWLGGPYFDVSPVEIVAEYRPVVEG